jgi:hypothetical protein
MKNVMFSSMVVWFTALTFSSIYPQTISYSDIQFKPAISIWPGKAPGSDDWTFSERVAEGPGGSKIHSNVVDPTLTLYLPDPAKTNGAAIILCPGGATWMLGFAETERAPNGSTPKVLLLSSLSIGSPRCSVRRSVPPWISGDGE